MPARFTGQGKNHIAQREQQPVMLKVSQFPSESLLPVLHFGGKLQGKK